MKWNDSGLVVSVCYLLFKFIEMRFVLKENKPLKILVMILF